MNRKGVALITVIILMFTVALLGASLIELITSVNLSSENVLNEAKKGNCNCETGNEIGFDTITEKFDLKKIYEIHDEIRFFNFNEVLILLSLSSLFPPPCGEE